MALLVSLQFSPLSVILMAPLKEKARRCSKGPGHAPLASFPDTCFSPFLLSNLKGTQFISNLPKNCHAERLCII